jgi:putative hydrolase of the HAD superfamily
MKLNLKGIKAVIFDLDNTLYNEKEYIDNALLNVAHTFCNIKGLNIKEVVYYLKNDLIINGTEEIFQRLLAKYNMNEDKSIIKKLITVYRNCNVSLNLYYDVIETLELIKSKGLKLGIVSNGFSYTQRNKINLLNIGSYFNTIIISGEWLPKDLWKPNKAPFELCFNNLGVKPQECLYVGDSYDKDIVGAYNAGAFPILIKRDINNDVYKLERHKGIDFVFISDFKYLINLCFERSIVSQDEKKH